MASLLMLECMCEGVSRWESFWLDDSSEMGRASAGSDMTVVMMSSTANSKEGSPGNTHAEGIREVSE